MLKHIVLMILSDPTNKTTTLKKPRFIAVDLEPTHYKMDLWNAFADFRSLEMQVVYTERRNWSPDAGHDYQSFPEERYPLKVLEGKGFIGSIHSTLIVLKLFLQIKPDLIYIAGYVHLQTILAIIYAAVSKKRFVVHADIFNNFRPVGRASWLKWVLRESLRRMVFSHAEAVLVCGRLGVETARVAGCPEEKIRNFPYCISLDRIMLDQPKSIPEFCLQDRESGKTILMFSGRMIARKGLRTLIEAMVSLKLETDWTLWVEGAGPDLHEYFALAAVHGLSERCRFLGFCQYDLHSWLMRSSDIVVVPSFEDSWGIVVDEGLQLGKAVISSDATGSGIDRIEHGVNGFIFPAGDVKKLALTISRLMKDSYLRTIVGIAAAESVRNVRPKDNVLTLFKDINKTK